MTFHPIAAIALACSVGLLVYLVIALLYPEKF
jgi:K+-transporting ATPase KdpF subunit